MAIIPPCRVLMPYSVKDVIKNKKPRSIFWNYKVIYTPLWGAVSEKTRKVVIKSSSMVFCRGE